LFSVGVFFFLPKIVPFMRDNVDKYGGAIEVADGQNGGALHDR
jgi:hypothetical protein